MFSLAFVLVFSAFSKVEAAATTCKSPSSGRDELTGLSCSVVAIPCPSTGYYEGTKEKCRQGQSTNTNSTGFALASTVTAKKGSTSVTTNKTIQAILAALGFLKDSGVDGKYGNLTKKAVEAFQRSRGLAVDGKVGKDTLAALNKEIANPNVITLLKKFGTGSGSASGGTSTIPPTDFTKGLDLNKETEWGTAVSFNSKGEGIVYMRDFGIDPKNGLRNTMTTYVERPPTEQ